MSKTNREIFSLLLDHFDPASALWRAAELKEVCSFIDSRNISSGRMLDLGCGEGNIAKIIFSETKLDIIGLDNWQESLSEAKANGIYSGVLIADACKPCFKKESFKYVFSNSVIEHISDLGSALEGVGYILEPGGLFIFTVPTDKFGDFLFFPRFFNKIGFSRLASYYTAKRISLLQHCNLYGKRLWQEKLRDAGLKLIYSRHYLSQELLTLWDILAALGFFSRKAGLFNVFKKIAMLFKKAIFSKLKNYSLIKEPPEQNSAGLLLVAQR